MELAKSGAESYLPPDFTTRIRRPSSYTTPGERGSRARHESALRSGLRATGSQARLTTMS